jgi:hypothetical protein
MRNPCIDAVIAELRAAGIYDYEVARNHKHPQIHWGVNGSRRYLAVSATPSDSYAATKARADVRRLLKADGLLPREMPPRGPQPRALSLEQRVAALERQVMRLIGSE